MPLQNLIVVGATVSLVVSCLKAQYCEWASLTSGVNSSVHAFLASPIDELVIVVGNFDNAGGISASGVAAWDGDQWQALGAGVQGTAFCAMNWGDDLLVGGSFVSPGNNIARWDGSLWSGLGSGLPSTVHDLILFDDGDGETLYAAGAFGVRRWTGTQWNPVGTLGQVFAFAEIDFGAGPKLFVGGSEGLYELSSSDWQLKVAVGSGGSIRAMIATEMVGLPALVVGGNFGSPANRVFSWNGIQHAPMGDGFNAEVLDFTTFDDGTGESLYAVGRFTQSGSAALGRVAKWDGGGWTPAPAMADADVHAAEFMSLNDSAQMFIGGQFAQIEGVSSSRVATYICEPCLVDLDANLVLNFFDVAVFVLYFQTNNMAADANGDGQLNFFDFATFLQLYAAGCRGAS